MNILFVCTGNTCRSPMAEALMAKLAEDENLDIRTASAGLFANDGDSASPEAVIAMKKYGIDLSTHKAQSINNFLVERSDLILTMTAGHKMVFGEMAKGKVYTLCEYAGVEGDIDDPFGGDVEEYEEVAEMIYFALQAIVEKIGQEKL